MKYPDYSYKALINSLYSIYLVSLGLIFVKCKYPFSVCRYSGWTFFPKCACLVVLDC